MKEGDGESVAGVAVGHDEAVIEEFASEIPLGRFAEPDEIAQAVVFVASDRASYITGQSISVDGGIGRGLL